MSIEIEVVSSCLEGDYIILTVDKIWSTVERKTRTTTRMSGITFTPPAGQELRIALPQHSGAGTQPEGTISLINVQDLAFNQLMELDDAISKAEQEEAGSSSF